LRVTPTFSASSAWVRASSPRRSFRRLARRSGILVRAALEHAESDERGAQPEREDDMNRIARGQRLELCEHIRADPSENGGNEAPTHAFEPVGLGALVVDQV